MRNFYTQQVVSPAKTGGMRIDYDWDVTPNTLPLPATFTNDWVSTLKKENPDTAIRLYSRYPLSIRKGTEVYDKIETDALGAHEQNPKTPFYREEVIGNCQYICRVSYATFSGDVFFWPVRVVRVEPDGPPWVSSCEGR